MNINTKNVAFRNLKIYARQENSNTPKLFEIEGDIHQIKKTEGKFTVDGKGFYSDGKPLDLPAYLIDNAIKLMAKGAIILGETKQKGDGIDLPVYYETPDITEKVIPAVEKILQLSEKCKIDTTNPSAIGVSEF